MASPQLENGFTSLANEIWEHIAHVEALGISTRVLAVVIRYSYGFKRNNTTLPVSRIAGLSGLSERAVYRGLSALKKAGIVSRVDGALIFDKDWEIWHTTKHPLSKVSSLSNLTGTPVKSDRSLIHIRKEKELNKRAVRFTSTSFSQEFVMFWEAWPPMNGRSNPKTPAWKKWKALKLDHELNRILLALAADAARPDWLKDNGQFVPMTVTWLNQRRFDDYNALSQETKKSAFGVA